MGYSQNPPAKGPLLPEKVPQVGGCGTVQGTERQGRHTLIPVNDIPVQMHRDIAPVRGPLPTDKGGEDTGFVVLLRGRDDLLPGRCIHRRINPG